MDPKDMPCRVSAETRLYHAKPDIQPRFDPYDDDLMRDLCGKHLAPVIQSLLQSLALYEMTEASFKADPASAVEQFLPDMKALRKAVVRTWEEDL